MNFDIIKGNWKQVKGKIKQQWGKFTDDDIMRMKGSYDELTGKLQEKYGYKEDEAKQQLDDFIKLNKLEDKE